MPARAPIHRPKRSGAKVHGADWSKPWAKSNAPPRLSGRPLQRARARLFTADPLCTECRKQGRITAATQRDHVVALAEGGTDDEANIQGLCDQCHRAKTLREAARGRAGGGQKSGA